MILRKTFTSLSLFALCSSSVILNKKFSNRSMSEPSFRILVAGGSKFAKEAGIHSTCEILTVGSNGSIESAPFSSLNIPRRGANCALIPRKNGFRIWIIGGCTELDNSIIRHLDSGEYLDFRESPIVSGGRKWETGNWHLFPRLLNVGRSCFSTACISENSQGEFLLVLGGWNGVECLRSVEYIHSKVVDDDNTSPLPQIDACWTARPGPGITTTDVDSECVSNADLISPIKNGCTCTLEVPDVETNRRDLLLIGGWDGKRTLNTIFRYTFSSMASFRTPHLHRILPYAVECHSCVLHQNEAIYVTGGFDGLRVLDSIIRLDLKTDSIQVLPIKLSTPRECHCAEILIPGDSSSDSEPFLVVFGGWDGYKALRSAEVFRIIDQPPYLVPISVTEDALLHARNRACSVVLPK